MGRQGRVIFSNVSLLVRRTSSAVPDLGAGPEELGVMQTRS